MGVTYFIVLIYIMLIIIEIFIISLKITGLPREKARFQVISLLTSTGFTTKESELITQHPVRRKLAERLMVFKYFGGIVGAATLFNIYFNWVKTNVSSIDVFIWIVLLALMLSIMKNKWILGHLDYFIERQLVRQSERNKKKFDSENLLSRDDFGIIDVVLDENSYLIGTRLSESDIKSNQIQILQVDKGNTHFPFPKPDYVFQAGDRITIYGNLKNIKRLILNELEGEQEEENAG